MPVVVKSVPLTGSVMSVVPVAVSVTGNAPDVVNAPPRLMETPPMWPTVVANEPAVFVMSPVCAGSCAAWSVPTTPVESGSPVAFVNTPDDGVPSAGVTRVGLVSVSPATVEAVAPRLMVVEPIVTFGLAIFALGKSPVTPVGNGNPVACVRTPEDGVPKAGVMRVGDVFKTTLPVPVLVPTPVPPWDTDKSVVRPRMEVMSEFAPL